ncbi:MAG: ACP S-malonyltransferase [Spirochaetales bacterium]|nr:ACP S-malonyltransferase [Spirochaetales bacterium]
MKTCFLFPGQGAQYPGMGKDLWEESDQVKKLFDIASGKTGIDMKKLLFEGSEEDLKATDKTQIAVTLVNLSSSMLLQEKGIKPDGFAGFSLGEYAALCEAGVISIDDVFPIVKARGILMEKASRALDSGEGNPGMAAVIGLSYDQCKNILSKGNLPDVYPANYNGPDQIVFSGTYSGLTAAEPRCKEAGARRYIMLKVSGPFHSPLLSEAAAGLADVLAGYTFNDPSKPVFSNVTGTIVRSGKEAKELCIKQVTSTVKWVDEEKALIDNGFDTFIETGPGAVLTGLLKRYTKEYICQPAGTLVDIGKLITT